MATADIVMVNASANIISHELVIFRPKLLSRTRAIMNPSMKH